MFVKVSEKLVYPKPEFMSQHSGCYKVTFPRQNLFFDFLLYVLSPYIIFKYEYTGNTMYTSKFGLGGCFG